MQFVKTTVIAALVMVVLSALPALWVYGLAWVSQRIMEPMLIASVYSLVIHSHPSAPVRCSKPSSVYLPADLRHEHLVPVHVVGGERGRNPQRVGRLALFSRTRLGGGRMIVVGLFAALHRGDWITLVGIPLLLLAEIFGHAIAKTFEAAELQPRRLDSLPSAR